MSDQKSRKKAPTHNPEPAEIKSFHAYFEHQVGNHCAQHCLNNGLGHCIFSMPLIRMVDLIADYRTRANDVLTTNQHSFKLTAIEHQIGIQFSDNVCSNVGSILNILEKIGVKFIINATPLSIAQLVCDSVST